MPNDSLLADFQQNGFTYLKQALLPRLCQQLSIKIRNKLALQPLLHNSEPANYFAAVNRWPASYLIDKANLVKIINSLQLMVSQSLQLPLQAYEADIIYKSPYANKPTPCHQDIAYAFKRPYYASSWLGLNDVSVRDSPLQFLPQSHQQTILPAIDFWQPGFIDEIKQSEEWRKKAKLGLTSCGDALLFSSKIWHASLPHLSEQERIALIIRWGNPKLSYEEIPQPATVFFGMWNCGQYTKQLTLSYPR